MTDSLENAIQQNAQGPASASGDAGNVQQHKLTDQVAADKHLSGKRAMKSRGLGVKLLKISPSGAE